MPAPYTPSNIILQTGNGQNFLIWDQVVGATSYQVQRSTDGVNWTNTFTSPTNNYLDKVVTVGTNYFYQVASVNTNTTGGYIFTVTSANAQAGATYINNGQSFQVLNTIAAGTTLQTSSTGAPLASGTLTKISGTGDATITFSASTTTGGVSAYSTSYPLSITPCLPGQINLGYIRYQAQLRADKLNSEYLTTDEWNFNINQIIGELYDILVSKYGDNYFFAPPLIFNLSGQISYPIPDGSNYPVNGVNSPACYKFNGIDLNISGNALYNGNTSGWVPLPRTNWSDRDKYTIFPGQAANLFYGYQMSYALMGNQIYVFPPNTNSSLRIWYVPQLTQLLQDTDMLTYSISGWSEYVIVRAAMLAMSKEESSDKYALLERQLQMQIERIETQAANRDVGQPNSVSNTRSTMGDPGFGFGGNGYGGGFGGGMGGF